MNNKDRLEAKRAHIKIKISINPFMPEHLYKQLYKDSPGGGKDKDGDPILIKNFKSNVRIFNNKKIEENGTESGISTINTNKFILSEYDSGIEYGMQFEYFGRNYSVMETHEEIRFGGVVSIKAELMDITGGTSYAY
jgi:hypothetical protein